MSKTTHVPVLICGGGIAGLSAALLLRREGIVPLVVEKLPAVSPQPKARRFHPRSTEIFRMLGLNQQLAAASPPLGTFGVLTGPTLALAQPAAASDNLRHMRQRMARMPEVSPGANVSIPQSVLEPLLRQVAEQRGVTFRAGIEVISVSQTDTGVTALLRSDSPDGGRGEEITCEYLIAADGADSLIRESLAIDRTGYGHISANFDIFFRADLTEIAQAKPFVLCQIDNPSASGTLWLINGTDRWLFSTDTPGIEDLSESDRMALLRAVLGLPDLGIEIIDASPWESASYLAEQMSGGRVFLAGDAAHVMPPMASAGANNAVADMANLAWKLAAVLNGKAAPALLETYHTERYPDNRAMAEGSITSSGDAFGMVSAYVKGHGMPSDPLTTMFGTQYSDGAFVLDGRDDAPRDHFGPAGRPGTRLPHAWINESTSTLDLIGPGLTLITGPSNDTWTTQANRLQLQVVKVKHQDWLQEVHLPADGALLVRSDTIIAWHSMSSTSLQDALNQIFRLG